MNFKSSEALIARVNKELSSFQATGLLDEGDFYYWAKEVLLELNIPAFNPVHSIIPLNGNSKIAIPDDMYQLWSVWKYAQQTPQKEDVSHYQGQSRWIQYDSKCITEECDCPRIYKEDENIISTKWYIKESGASRTIKYNKQAPIKIVNFTINQCNEDSPCKYVNSDMQASMSKDHFYFNFDDGYVYLQYYALPKDDFGLPMVPDVIQIERAIENYFIYRMFRQLVYDTTLDVAQRFTLAKEEYQRAFDKAKTYVKTPTFASIVKIGEAAKGRYKMFELSHARE